MTDGAGASLIIDLDAVAANYRLLSDLAGGAETAPVVKADGYGLGAGPVARRLWAEGARTFFVARLSEGLALRQALGDRSADILIFDGLLADPSIYIAAGLTPVINTIEQAQRWQGPAALHVDTGMNRLGVNARETEALAREGLNVSLLISHLACASQGPNSTNDQQRDAFAAARALFPGARASLANSAGVFLGKDFTLDLARPGISLYGGRPFEAPEPRLRAVATLTAPILQIRDVAVGETVGYGAAWKAEQTTRVAIVAAGYADGILRAADQGAYGWLGGATLPYLGRVSMDMVALDLTNVAAARTGDSVELVGPHVLVDDLAAASGTIAYEILTRLSARAARTYIGGQA